MTRQAAPSHSATRLEELEQTTAGLHQVGATRATHTIVIATNTTPPPIN